MNEKSLSYLAGFFDGEGSISILKRKKGDWNISHFLRVSIGQKDGATLDWIKENFGGNVYLVSRNGSYVWAISDYKGYKFIKILSPFLLYKKPQAELAIKFYEERIMNSRRTTKHKHTALTVKELELRENMFLEMKLLKKTIIKSKYAGSTTKRADPKGM
jgi:hypothetical protein